MISTLFSMHNIKYVISVDDCFFVRKREEMEAAVYSEMCISLDPFKVILSASSQAEEFDAINEVLELGSDASTLMQSLVADLDWNYIQLTIACALAKCLNDSTKCIPTAPFFKSFGTTHHRFQLKMHIKLMLYLIMSIQT